MTSEDRIVYYRERAAEARSKADEIADDTVRTMMIGVAETWDRLAELEIKNPLLPSNLTHTGS